MQPLGELHLRFDAADNGNSTQLASTEFFHALLGKRIRSVRGRSAGAFGSVGTFQWSPAVQGFAILVLRSLATRIAVASENFILKGTADTPASSLDYALAKQTSWLGDMLGVDSQGNLVARRLIRRSNPERKSGPEVALSINHNFLPIERISVTIGEQIVSCSDQLEKLAKSVESEWRSHRSKSSPNVRTRGKQLDSPQRFVPALVPDCGNRPPVEAEQSRALSLPVSFSAGERINGFLSSQQRNGPLVAPFNSPVFQPQIRKIFREEISQMLWQTDIFTRNNYRALVDRTTADPAFKTIAPKSASVVSLLDEALASGDRIGLSHHDFGALGSVLSREKFSIAIPADLVAAVSLLYYGRYVTGVPFDINFRFSHAPDIVRRVIASEFQELPSLLVLSVAPAAQLLAHFSGRGDCPYVPLMLMPQISRRVVATRTTSAKNSGALGHGRFLCLHDTPSTSKSYFSGLLAQEHVLKRKVVCENSEPDESTCQLREGDPDVRAIFVFPHYNFNVLFNNCRVMDAQTGDLQRTQTLALIRSDILRNSSTVKALDILIRDAWLALRESPQLLDLIVTLMLEDREYVKYIRRFGGLHHINLENIDQFRFLEAV